MKVKFLYFLILAFFLTFNYSCSSHKYVTRKQVPVEFRAQWENGIEDYPSYMAIKKNQPIDSLPAIIPRPLKCDLTLFADFSKVWQNYIPIYLINASNDSIKLNSEDGDIYIKLEAWDAVRSKWIRVQPHLYSWCGNSYGKIMLHSKSFIFYRGMFPLNENGVKTRVRYKLYNGPDSVVSNIGFAQVNEDMVEQSKFDLMSIAQGDSTFITGIALGETTIPPSHSIFYSPEYVRLIAIERLAEFPSESTTSNLIQLAVDQKLSDYFRKGAVRSLGKLGGVRGKLTILKLLTDLDISDDLSVTAFEALNKADALEFLKTIWSNRQYLPRYSICHIVSNTFRLENEGERIENIYRKMWNADSIGFLRSYKCSLDSAIANQRKDYPNHYKFYLLDSTLYHYIASKKNDLSDPIIKDVMICYGEYKPSDLLDYITSLYQNPLTPDSLKQQLQFVYEMHYAKLFPELEVRVERTQFQLKERLLIPIKGSVQNNTDSTFIFSKDSLIQNLHLRIKISEHKGDPKNREYIDYEISNIELIWSANNGSSPPDTIVTLFPHKKYEFTFLFDVDKFIKEKQKTWYGIDIKGEWRLSSFNIVPLTVKGVMTSFTLQ